MCSLVWDLSFVDQFSTGPHSIVWAGVRVTIKYSNDFALNYWIIMLYSAPPHISIFLMFFAKKYLNIHEATLHGQSTAKNVSFLHNSDSFYGHPVASTNLVILMSLASKDIFVWRWRWHEHAILTKYCSENRTQPNTRSCTVTRAWKRAIRRFVITEKALTRVFS